MTNIQDILHLFTPVSEGLPEKEQEVFILVSLSRGIILHVSSCNSSGEWYSNFSDKVITHWLDLSKLTTKSRAIKLAEEAYENCNYPVSSQLSFDELIQENQKEL